MAPAIKTLFWYKTRSDCITKLKTVKIQKVHYEGIPLAGALAINNPSLWHLCSRHKSVSARNEFWCSFANIMAFISKCPYYSFRVHLNFVP